MHTPKRALRQHRYLSFLILCIGIVYGQAFAQQAAYPFQNTSLSMETRVADLVARLTLEEKVAQMLNATPAIERLGIPAYEWWNEDLHGVARTQYKVTVYPQAIAMAATWDTAALHYMGAYSATEGRAIYNRCLLEGNPGKRYNGLTYWTPNINIFRDPRWGRGQETYGEDPYLTAMMGTAFVHGLQGNHPTYLQAAACAKHYAVHSGPEPLRHNFNAVASGTDLWNTYLPAFEQLIVKAKVAGVMCAYNAYEGQPCCGSDFLMTDILYNQWHFNGYVTSDCGGIGDFFKKHKTHPDAVHAATDAVLHGTDIECGRDAYHTLVEGVKQHLISEATIDSSVKKLMMIRFRLGLFDPIAQVPYAQITDTALEAAAHTALSLQMARSSIVLLKNEHTLPLSKKIKKIAVIGPNADNKAVVLGNYNGVPSHIATALEGIRQKVGSNTEVYYEKAIDYTTDTIFQQGQDVQFTYGGRPGFTASYYANKELKGTPVIIRQEGEPDHFWQEGELIDNKLPANDFSARYTASFTTSRAMDITLELDANDGYNLYINGEKKIDAWHKNTWQPKEITLHAAAGETDTVVIEYLQRDGSGYLRLHQGRSAKTDFAALASRVKDADAIVYIGGISPSLEGESMKVSHEGFDGGDRTSILLPAVQTSLLQQLSKLGKPLVFVMMTGSAIAIPWEAAHVPAIVNTWYGGQAAGTALADVLFGDYNPAGRLPVTFYASDADLPDFQDYSMKGRTYRYFSGKPLYPFGYGLSYTSFSYQELQVPTTLPAMPQQAIPVSVTVSNTGGKDGEEVVQLYASFEGEGYPRSSLVAFRRISLQKGAKQKVDFLLSPAQVALKDEHGNPYMPAGKMTIYAGGTSPGSSTLRTISQTITIAK